MRFFTLFSRRFLTSTSVGALVVVPCTVPEKTFYSLRPQSLSCGTQTATTYVEKDASAFEAASKLQKRRMWRRFFANKKAHTWHGSEAISVSPAKKIKSRRIRKAKTAPRASLVCQFPVAGDLPITDTMLHKELDEAIASWSSSPSKAKVVEEAPSKKKRRWVFSTSGKRRLALLSLMVPGYENAHLVGASRLCEGASEEDLFKAYRQTVDANPRCELPELIGGIARCVGSHGVEARDALEEPEKVKEENEENEESKEQDEENEEFVDAEAGPEFLPKIVSPNDFMILPNSGCSLALNQTVVFRSQKAHCETLCPITDDEDQASEPEFETPDSENESDYASLEFNSLVGVKSPKKSGPLAAMARFSKRWGSRAVHAKSAWKEHRALRRSEKKAALELAAEEKKLRIAECERLVNSILSRARAQGFQRAQKYWAQRKKLKVTLEALEAECKERTPQAVMAARAVARVTAAFIDSSNANGGRMAANEAAREVREVREVREEEARAAAAHAIKKNAKDVVADEVARNDVAKRIASNAEKKNLKTKAEPEKVRFQHLLAPSAAKAALRLSPQAGTVHTKRGEYTKILQEKQKTMELESRRTAMNGARAAATENSQKGLTPADFAASPKYSRSPVSCSLTSHSPRSPAKSPRSMAANSDSSMSPQPLETRKPKHSKTSRVPLCDRHSHMLCDFDTASSPLPATRHT